MSRNRLTLTADFDQSNPSDAKFLISGEATSRRINKIPLSTFIEETGQLNNPDNDIALMVQAIATFIIGMTTMNPLLLQTYDPLKRLIEEYDLNEQYPQGVAQGLSTLDERHRPMVSNFFKRTH